MTAKPKFDFLIEYVLALFEENKLNLTEEQKKLYIPQILGQIELRLGVELLPKLNAAQKEVFVKMTNDPKTTAMDWNKFWKDSVPTFDEDVKNILVKFAEKVKTILAAQQ